MDRRSFGAMAEEEAAAYLLEQGYSIVRRNFRTRFGEIDVVAMDGHVLTFVEIRARSGANQWVAPEESVLYGWKRQKVIRAAKCYLIQYPTSLPCRFDVLGITHRVLDQAPKFRLMKDAFRVGS